MLEVYIWCPQDHEDIERVRTYQEKQYAMQCCLSSWLHQQLPLASEGLLLSLGDHPLLPDEEHSSHSTHTYKIVVTRGNDINSKKF